MSDLIKNIPQQQVDLLEQEFLRLPQVECPVTHHFGPGLYIRQVEMPAGALVIGHAHTRPCMNILLRGVITLRGEDGRVDTLTAPVTFMGSVGRKVAHIIEDVIWQNVYATDETDLNVIESQVIIKSEAWQQACLEKNKESICLG